MAAVLKRVGADPPASCSPPRSPPTNKAFAFALAQAWELGRNSLFFTLTTPCGAHRRPLGSATKTMPPRRARDAASGAFGPACARRGRALRLVVRPGLAADRFSATCASGKSTASWMGTHSPRPYWQAAGGPVGRGCSSHRQGPGLHRGSHVVDGAYREFSPAPSCAP